MKKLFFQVALLSTVFGCRSEAPPTTPASVDKAGLIEMLHRETVVLENGDALCAGVWVAPTQVLTANHCVKEELGELTVNGLPALTLRQDEPNDTALVQVAKDPGSHPVALLGPLPRVGDHVMTMGHPTRLMYSYSSGEVSAIRYEDGESVIQVTVPISPGNSGGGLFNDSGELVGICSYERVGRGIQGLNFFHPVTLYSF